MFKTSLLLFAVVLGLTRRAESLQCLECHSFESWEDCHANKKDPAPCPEESIRCHSFMTADEANEGGDVQKYFEKGCTSYGEEECHAQRPCEGFAEFLKILYDDSRNVTQCEYKCCAQNNCNAPPPQ